MLHGDGRGSEAELVQLLDPPLPKVRSTRGHDLVGSGLRPRSTVPGPPQGRAWFLVRMLAAPLGFVAVDVAGDLRGAGAERTGVRSELCHLERCRVESSVYPCAASTARNSGSQTSAACPIPLMASMLSTTPTECSPRHAPAASSARADLQVEVVVRVAGTARVVPHHRSLEMLDRDLDLLATWSNPGRGVVGEPADDLRRRLVLGGVVSGSDLRVQGGGQRPGLGSVDDNLDEPQPLLVPAKSTLRRTGRDVEAGKPSVRRPDRPTIPLP